MDTVPQLKTIVVDDVYNFIGHIVCDSASNSEIVLPIIVDNQLFGVLDIDSPIKSRFTNRDKDILENCVKFYRTKFKN